jgi:hypothetical protein
MGAGLFKQTVDTNLTPRCQRHQDQKFFAPLFFKKRLLSLA